MWYLFTYDSKSGLDPTVDRFDGMQGALSWVSGSNGPGCGVDIERLYTRKEAEDIDKAIATAQPESPRALEWKKAETIAYELAELDEVIGEQIEAVADPAKQWPDRKVAILLTAEDAQAISDNLSPQYLPPVVRAMLGQIDEALVRRGQRLAEEAGCEP